MSCRAGPSVGSLASRRQEITDYVEFDPALAIKFTIYRRMPSGSPGDAGMVGSQQYGPLLDVEVPGG